MSEIEYYILDGKYHTDVFAHCDQLQLTTHGLCVFSYIAVLIRVFRQTIKIKIHQKKCEYAKYNRRIKIKYM